MTSIKISNQLSTTSTTINNVFIDRYMPAANGEFVKVYLYLIRMASCGQSPTIADMADALDNTESDILRALKYWQKQDLLVMHCNALNDLEFIELLPIPEETEAAAPTFNIVKSHTKAGAALSSEVENTKKPVITSAVNTLPVMNNTTPVLNNGPALATSQATASVVNMPPAKPNYDMAEIQRNMDNSDLRHLPYEAEVLLGTTLSSDDLNTLYYLHDKLAFSSDLISYLIEYCVLNDKKSIRYIEKTAINWHEHNITTVEAAKVYSSRYTKLNSAVMHALGLRGASLAEAQLNYIRKWTNEYAMDQSLIVEACNRTMLQTGNPSFQYADKILSNWHNAGITCLAQVEKESQSFRENQASQQNSNSGYRNNNRKNSNSSTPNQFHDFIQGEDIDYDAIIPKTIPSVDLD